MLKGKAELWHTNGISNTTWDGLKASIENWGIKLETCFQISPEIALEKLQKLKFTIDDVRKFKNLEEFVENIVIVVKSEGTVESEYPQLVTSYHRLAAELRIYIPASTPDTKLTIFDKQKNQ